MKTLRLTLAAISMLWAASVSASPRAPKPPAPTLEVLDLIAEAAKRPLSVSEVQSIYQTPTGAITFLEPLIRDRLNAKRKAQPLPGEPAGDRCLADVLHALAGLAADGTLSDADWLKVWSSHGNVAATAYQIVMQGQRPDRLFGADYLARFGRKTLPPSAVRHWFASYSQPSTDIDAFARNSVWDSAMVELAVAKLSRLGKPGRDALVKMMAETAGTSHSARHRTEFVALHVLGSAGDKRLTKLTFSTLRGDDDVAFLNLALSKPGQRVPTRWTQAGYFWKHSGCGRQF